MLASVSSCDEGVVEVFGGGGDSDDDFGMPCFEMSQSTVLPTAPPEEDYPVGCEVELRDAEYARELHNRGRWESTFELLFSVPRRSVIVRRHAGDFTFVVCASVQGYEQVGVTLYRACLGELKVKDTLQLEESIIREDMEDMDTDRTSLQNLMKPYPPESQNAPDEAMSEIRAGPSAPRLEARHPVSQKKVGHRPDVDAPPWLVPAPPQDAPGATSAMKRTSSSNVQEVRARKRFNEAMSEGTAFFNNKQYTEALECYTRAMQAEHAERARALCSRSACYLMLDNHKAALADAFEAISANKKDFNGYVRAANVYNSARRFDKAHMYYLRAIKLKRNDRRICALFVSNFASKLYSVQTSKLPFKIVYQKNCLQAITRRAIHADTTIMCEETALCCPLSRWRGSGTYLPDFPVCSRCGKHLKRWVDVKGALPELSEHLYTAMCRPTDAIPCKADCGRFYCSEACRDKAWQLYHFLECPATGKWREGMCKLDTFLTQKVVEEAQSQHNSGVAQKPLLSNTLLNAIESVSMLTIATCVRIAVRMFCALEGGTITTSDCGHRFDFMTVAPEVEAQREAVVPFLQECYDILGPHFVLLERDRLSMKFFIDCYERAKSNALYVTTTPWKHMCDEARNVGNFLSLTANADPDMPLGHNNFMPSDVQKEIHDLLRLPETGPEGLQSTWLCLFELTTPIMSFSDKLYTTTRGKRQPNAAIRTTVEPTLCIHLDSVCEIGPKEPLIVARLTRLECAK